MAVIDRIRMAARRSDCIVAVFPDDGGRVYSPLTSRYHSLGTASTGVRDVDDGLIAFTNCRVENGAFVSDGDVTGDPRCCVQTGYGLAGEEAHHTMLVKAFIPSAHFRQATSWHCVRLMWQGSRNSNCTWGIGINYSASSQSLGLDNAVFLQSPREYSQAGSGSTSCSSSFAFSLNDIADKWIVMASTINGAQSLSRYYLDGVHIKDNDFGSRSFDYGSPKQRRTLFRNDASVTEPARALKIGDGESGSSTIYTGIRFAWGLVFNSILSEEEIRELSE